MAVKDKAQMTYKIRIIILIYRNKINHLNTDIGDEIIFWVNFNEI